MRERGYTSKFIKVNGRSSVTTKFQCIIGYHAVQYEKRSREEREYGEKVCKLSKILFILFLDVILVYENMGLSLNVSE